MSIKKKILFSFTAMGMFAVIGFIAGEVAVRVYRGKLLSTENIRKVYTNPKTSRIAVGYHETLGYVPKPNSVVTDQKTGCVITVNENSIRINGPGDPLAGHPILAVGDSFTFGIGVVDDHETWPAQLERRIGQRVVNGGMGAYGVDQTVLRAELLMQKYSPRIVIVSMIEDDIRRCEFSYWNAWKPYFDIVDGQLELRNVPVPTSPAPRHLAWLGDTLGYSHLADSLLRSIAWKWWLYDGIEKVAHRRGVEVVCLLLHRIKEIAERSGVPVLLVMQGRWETEESKQILKHAQAIGLPALNLVSPLCQMIEANPDVVDQFMARNHMSAQGNQWVAQQIADQLVHLGMIEGISENPLPPE